jgi:hypothetical protein
MDEKERREQLLRSLEHAATERWGKTEAENIRAELATTAEAIARVEQFELPQEEEPPTTAVLTRLKTIPSNIRRE